MFTKNLKKAMLFLACILTAAFAFMPMSSCTKTKSNLVISSDTLVFHGNETLQLHLSTERVEGCPFSVHDYPYWLEVSPRSGTLYQDQDFVLTLTSNMDTVMHGPLKGNLYIDLYVDNLYDTRIVPVVGIPGDHILYSIPDTLVFQSGDDDKPLHIKNSGNAEITYSISSSTSYASLSSTSGTLAEGAETNIMVHIDRNGILTESDPKLIVTINDSNIPVSLFVEKKQIIDADVIDAEYSKTTDLMVYVTTACTLNVYNPATQSTESIPLSYYPTCVSLSSDGTKVAVGHDANVTYVDLTTMSVVNTFPISCEALDIVMADNGWAYIFPKRDQWESIRCIEITNPNAMESTSGGWDIYAGTKAKMHPSGKFIYGAINGLSPDDIEKYDIQNGTASYMYDSPYHGDYSMGGDLWFSEDGSRIFVRSGCVFKASEIQSLDMTYNGRLTTEDASNYNQIKWIEHSESMNDIFIICSGNNYYWEASNNPYVFIHNAANLIFKDKIRLENYFVPMNNGMVKQYQPNPHFVFANSTNGEIYVITKAVDSGLQHEWAIQTIQVE